MIDIKETSYIKNYFNLQSEADIAKFFPKNKKLKHILMTKVHRMLHFFQTGTWINKHLVLNFAINHAEITDYLKERLIYRKVLAYSHHIYVPTMSFWDRQKINLQFLGRFFKFPQVVGSLTPSSARLAQAIVKQIPKECEKKRYILEVGPGTGVFTDKIIKRLNPADELHLVEYDSLFFQLLKAKYSHIPNVKIFQADITTYQSGNENKHQIKYDFIISGLPLNKFSVEFVEKIFGKYEQISKTGTIISYFEYLFIPTLIKVLNKRKYRHLKPVLDKKETFYQHYKHSIDKVWLNITPAQVRHHQMY